MTKEYLMKLQYKFMGWYPPKEITATANERPKLLVEVKAETYYRLKTMAKKFLKM